MSYPIIPSLLLAGAVLAPLAEGARTRQQSRAQGAQDASLVVNKEADSFAIADQLYAQALATKSDPVSRRALMSRSAELYGNFVKNYPMSSLRDKAQYLQAICLDESGDGRKAHEALTTIADKRKGEYAAAAAYTLANRAADQLKWADARRYFAVAHRESRRNDLRADATYREGRAWLMGDAPDRARAEECFRRLQLMQEVPPAVLQAGLLALAQMKTEARNDDDEAYALYQRILKTPALDPNVRGTATLQAARLAARLGKSKESQELYRKLSTMRGMEKYAGEAQMETLINLYRQGDYAGIIEEAQNTPLDMDDLEKRARRALIIGMAYMESSRYDEASKWFLEVEKSQPRTVMAADAAYRRVICVRQMRGNNNFITVAQSYLDTYAVPETETADLPANDLVRYMYADRLIHADRLQPAHEQLQILNIKSLPESVRADALYKKAWLSAQVGEGDPIADLSEFITTFAEDSRLADALTLRATTYVKQGNLPEALKDFDRVIKEFPRSDAAPICCQRAAQACTGKKPELMVAYYQKLISHADRVKPAATAEAHYNIARVLYEKDAAAAIVHFQEARTIYPEYYAKLVDLSLVQCYYKLKDVARLHEALTALEKNNPASYKALPPVILRWCGWMCSQSADYVSANKYLSDAILREPTESYTDADGTEKTRPKVEPLVWKTLAHARLELGQYERGLEAARHYVSMETQAYRKADGMRDQARLLIGLKRSQEARKICEEAIALGIDGPLKSAVFITLGDAFYVDKQYTEAARYYGRTANVAKDKELKPQALYKIAAALKRAGKAGEAKQYEDILTKEFPGWTPSRHDSVLIGGRPL